MIGSLKFIVAFIFGLLSSLTVLAGTFAGKVLDENGSPLAGAVIKGADGPVSVISDADGNFTFVIPGEKAADITVTYVGFEPLSAVIRSDSPILISMVPDRTILDEVVVTATRTPKSIKDVPVVTRLITSDEIKKADATNIQDLLTEELPGLEFGYAMSQETTLNMSGFGGSAVLFLVDGERLAGETMDNVDFNRLNLYNVGRVEIVKGASSALYGANAVGGVVNLITKESNEPWRLNVNSRYRSFGNEWRHGADLNLHSGKFTSNTNFMYSAMETVKLTDAFDTESKIQNVFGGKTLNVKERLTIQATDGLRLIARGGYFNRVSNRINYDDRYIDYTAGIRGLWNIQPFQTLELSYSYDQYDKQRYVGGDRTHDHDYSNRQHIVHGLYTHFFGTNALTVGADYMHDYLLTYQFVNDEAHSQSSVDAFVQFDYNPLSWLNIVASVRDDYFSESDNNALTARFATMFKFNDFSIRANYAGGFRAPTLKEMYMCFDMAGIQMIYGNPDLKPERSHNFNLAFERIGQIRNTFLKGSYSTTLSGYYNYYDSRITTTDFPGNADTEEGAVYTNEDGVKAMGLDASVRYRSVSGIGLSVSYNFLHMAGNTLDSQFSQPRPHSMTWRLDYDKRLCSVYKLYAGISGRFLSKPKSNYATDGAYSLWKFTLQQRVWRGVDINFAIDNIMNYKPKVYYWNSPPTTGRTWTVGISLDINDFF